MNVLVDSSVCCTKGSKLSVSWENIPLITEIKKLRLSTDDLQGNAVFHFAFLAENTSLHVFYMHKCPFELPCKQIGPFLENVKFKM